MDCRGAFLVGFLWKQRCFSRTLRTYTTLFGPLSPGSLPLAAFHFWYSEHTKHRGDIRAAKLARIGIGRLTLEFFRADSVGSAGRRLGHRSGGGGRLVLFRPDSARQCGAARGGAWDTGLVERDGSSSPVRTHGGGARRRLGHRSGGGGRLELFRPDARAVRGAVHLAVHLPVFRRGRSRFLSLQPHKSDCNMQEKMIEYIRLSREIQRRLAAPCFEPE